MFRTVLRYALFIAVVLLVVVLACAVGLLPWKSWIGHQLQNRLEAKGLQNVQLTVSSVGLSGISLEKISVGGPEPLLLDHVTIGYDIGDLWGGRLQALDLGGVHLKVTQAGDRWDIEGLEIALGTSPETAPQPLTLPVTRAALTTIPFERAKLEDSSLQFTTEAWHAELPLQLTFQKQPVPKITTQAKTLQFTWQELVIAADTASFETTLQEEQQRWEGTWGISGINLKGVPLPIPELKASGTLTTHADHVALTGTFTSADTKYKVDLTLDYRAEKSSLTINFATLPWNGGTLSVRDVKIPFAGNAPIHANLEVQHVSVDALMRMLTGKRASATGVVSGTIPVTFNVDGSMVIHEGKLAANEPGTIVVAPEAIPGDNAQLTLVRDMLQNLHYKLLSVTMDSGKDNKLSVNLAIEGNNPEVYEGRPVKLNVHFGGDVLELLQQSMVSFTDPKKFLQQGDHEK